ncbi:MAG TPA: gamma-glutamyltransferase [Gammaproteobacteria bacterium]|nr:gamma-glutamyltransferase [Gammaproteobacteria bacterium]
MSRIKAAGQLFCSFFIVCVLCQSAVAGTAPAAIASAHPAATNAGFEVLEQGGNAFDAAIAVAATLAVVEPTGSGLGGGGFWLLHRVSDNYQTMIDGRERAPAASTAGMYLDDSGNPVPGLSLYGALAAGIPGTPAAIDHMAKRYGHLPLSVSLAPAIRAAEQGFAAYPRYIRLLEARLKYLSPATRKIFMAPDGAVPALGTMIRQPELAETLRQLARFGRSGFYAGETGSKLISSVQKQGGIWTQQDLDDYEVVERPPVIGQYHNARFVIASPPSSGGVAIMQMLKMLDTLNYAGLDKQQRRQKVIEVMRRAYRDRARYMGDPDHVEINLQKLLSDAYLEKLASSIGDEASMFDTPGTASVKGSDTTHFSIIDGDGNRVAATLSNNYYFGSGIVAEGTGVTLNNEMDDFSAQPGAANVWGLTGNQANAIAPGKRPLSSMSPAFIERGDEVVVIGTPGGSRIITMVLLAMLDYLHEGGSVEDWVALPRYHHQYRPDVVQFEPGAISEDEQFDLESKGYVLQERSRPYGNMQTVWMNRSTGEMQAASDPRNQGSAEVRVLQTLSDVAVGAVVGRE